MPNYLLFTNFLLILISAFLGGITAKKLKQPLVFGYLLAGILVSFLIEALGLRKVNLNLLLEVGLALLMFTFGLEFSLFKLGKIKKTAIFGASVQVIFSIILGILILYKLFGFSFKTSLVAASAFSLSSAAIVVKILQDKNNLESLPGEIMLGWLLVQDLMAIPLFCILPFVTDGNGLRKEKLIFSLAGILFLGFIWIGARKIVPKFATLVSLLKNRELLLLFSLAVGVSLAYITYSLGFSLALGGFLAGLILSQVSINHAIFAEVRPLKDVFFALFFVCLGLSLNPTFVLLNWSKIILISLLFVLIKSFLIGTVLSFFGYHAKVIFQSSLGLAGVGEFSFAYVLVAFAEKSLNSSSFSLIISVALLTMALTPAMFCLADKLYAKASLKAVKFPKVYRKFFVGFDHRLPVSELPFENHIVVLGYGRVGSWVGAVLDKVNVPYLVVEYNPSIVRQLRLEGKKVIFGDPADLDVLDFAQVDKARLVVLAIPDPLTLKMAVANCRLLNPKVKIICRSHLEEDLAELKSLGVNNIIQPEFEAALSISHRALQGMGFKKEEINEKLREVKREHES